MMPPGSVLTSAQGCLAIPIRAACRSTGRRSRAMPGSTPFQTTVADILTEKTALAAEQTGYKTIAIAGGVSANSGLRAAMERMCAERGYALYVPPLSLCGDNAAMIACQGSYNFLAGMTADESLNAYASGTAIGEMKA